MLRLFFALRPVLDENSALGAAAAPLVSALGAERVPPENFHATLCFVGALEPARLDALRAVAAAVRGRSVTLCIDSLEFWEKPKVLCATAADDAAALPARELAEALGGALIAAGFAPDIKPFRAHLTLGRKVPAAAAAKLAWPWPLMPSHVVSCDRFFLMESRRGETGSIYSAVDSWPLYG
jgi:2'-5' RNA ligase